MAKELREVFRCNGRYAQCQFMTTWKSEPPIYISCFEPETGQHFIARQQHGCWSEVSTSFLAFKLNNNL